MADQLIRALALDGGARVVVTETTGVVERLRAVHDTAPTSTAALGRVATGALLLASSLEKLTHREPVLTIEVEGGGPIGRVLATASPAGWVRALASNPAADRESRPDGKLDVAGVVGASGTLSVARDLGAGEPYRGIVPLVSGEIGVDLATYLRDSEQMRTAIGIGVFVGRAGDVRHAGGLLVQLLPSVNEEEAVALEERLRTFGEVTTRLREGQPPAEWLTQLFPGGWQPLGDQAVEFRCGCSRDRVERALKLLGVNELTRLLEEAAGENTEVTCEFCHTAYEVAPGELAGLLLEVRDDLADTNAEPPS